MPGHSAKSALVVCASLCASLSTAIAATSPPTYNFTYSYNGKQYSDLFIGTAPKAGGSSTIVTHIVPVKFTVGSFVADPSAKDSHGMSPVTYTVASPIFDSTTDYKQGKVDVGATQYIDAFNRVNEWGLLHKAKRPGWHVLLSPKIETGLSFNNPSGATVATDFGVKVVNYNISAFDSAVQSTIKQFPASDLVVFITTQTYLTSGGCCIGGYHSYTGSQSYLMFTYITDSQVVLGVDVSALSLELGLWLDDPQVNNTSPCGSYDVGDPPDGSNNHPFGLWTYTLNGVPYHLRDMATPVYFGAPAKTSANGFFTFQGFKGLTVCEGAP
jgi:hypothetical protein